MRLKEGFVLRDVAGQAVVIATGEASKDFHGMVKLNETGRLVWLGLAKGLSDQQIADQIVEAYDVSSEQALLDVAALVDKIDQAGFLV